MDDATRTRQSPSRRTPHVLSRSIAAVTVVASTLLVAACGDDSSDAASVAPATSSASPAITTTAPAVTPTTDRADATTTTTALTATTERLATTTTNAVEPTTIDVLATDFAFSGLPSTIPAGSKISLTNAEGAEPHEIVAVRVDDSDTRSTEELQAKGAEPATLEPEFALWIISLPGETNSSVRVGDGTLEPGRYLYFCSINQGTTVEGVQSYLNGGEPPAGGTPHYDLGMSGWVTVE